MSNAADTAAHIAEEIALALVPVAVDVFQGKAEPEVMRDAMAAGRNLIVQIESEHLLAAHGALLLADLRALGRIPSAILAWLNEHGAPHNPDPDFDPHNRITP